MAVPAKLVPYKSAPKRFQNDLDWVKGLLALFTEMYNKPEEQPEYKLIVDQIDKLEAKNETDGQMATGDMTPTAKKEAADQILGNKFMKYKGKAGLNELAHVTDFERKLCKRISNPKAIKEHLNEEIVKYINLQGVVLDPRLINQLSDYFELYGHKLEGKLETYGGLEIDDNWYLGRSLIQPANGPMPTWTRFLSRLSDPEAFAAWYYGLASKKYKGRQVLWVHGENGEDGKTFVMKLLNEHLFAGVSHSLANAAFSPGAERFLGQEMVDKYVIMWDDCKNDRAIFSEIIKQVSAGDEGNPIRIEGKGKDVYSAPVDCRLCINSNSKPQLSNDNFILSRCLYINVAKLEDKPDVDLKAKFIAELPQFLEYGRQCFEMACTDKRKIAQNEKTQVLIDQIVAEYQEPQDSTFNALFVYTDAYTDTLTPADIRAALSTQKITDRFAIQAFYKWMEDVLGVKKLHTTLGKKTSVVLRGIRLKNTTDRYNEGQFR